MQTIEITDNNQLILLEQPEQFIDFSQEGGKKHKSRKQKFLGQGSFGCTFMPGLDCKSKKCKTNRSKHLVNKIQEVTRDSENELYISNFIKYKIKNYNKRFAPVEKHNIIKFNKIKDSNMFDYITKKCNDSVFNQYSDSNYFYFINKDYYMFYMRYIKGRPLGDYLTNYFNKLSPDNFYNNYFYSLYYLLNSIYIFNKIKLVHNDLHNNNIMYDLDLKKPIIIDFGMSYKTKSCYKYVSGIDFHKIKDIFICWAPYYERGGGYWYLTEKKFISFITYNNLLIDTPLEKFHPINVSSNFEKNFLTKDLIDFFVNDIYNSFKLWPEMKDIFKPNEFNEYYKIISNYYYKFLPENDTENKYQYISDIVAELLPYVFKYYDLHSLSSNFIQNLYKKIQNEILNKSNKNNSQNYIDIYYGFINQLFKKVYYPDPRYRLSSHQFISIFSFVFKYCKNNHSKILEENNFIHDFHHKFKLLLLDINFDYDLFFNKNYAYIDFNIILNHNNFNIIKNFNHEIL
tara:strand:- start:5692 stop:7233 length:1542 start_codon:yes stop_codon:yes gene_type:complete